LRDLTLVETADGLAAVAARAAGAARVAVDVEANGLHAFRPALCTLQLAWPEVGGVAVAVVDTLAVTAQVGGLGLLAPLLGPAGPVKVLHDLTFDARLLAEAGAPLGRVRDTSVAARLLGAAKVGLSALLASELGIAHAKHLQQHDWSRRPLMPEELEYLAGDVRHLPALDERLAQRAEALDIAPEIAEECAYKLGTALAPPHDTRPAYVRIKGAAALDPPGRAVLRRLCQAREAAAAAADLPPFKVTSNEILLELAARRPLDLPALAAVRGACSGNAARWASDWLAAIAEGVRDGEVPAEDQPFFAPVVPDRGALARRRAREAQVTAWRKVEAARRGIDLQAVLPGHCAAGLVDALLANDEHPDAAALQAAVACIPGLGSRRRDRYGAAFVALGAKPPTKGGIAPA
jgi:ribonuclease D